MALTDAQLEQALPNFYKLKKSVQRLEKDIQGISKSETEGSLSAYEKMLRHELQVIMVEVPGVGVDISRLVNRRRGDITNQAIRAGLARVEEVLKER